MGQDGGNLRRLGVNIVYALTSNFVEYAKPSMKSLLEHNPDAKIYLLTDEDVKPDIPMTVINVSQQNYFDPRSCVNLPNNFGGYINLLKVAYADLLPKLQKVIHLDADTIITDSLDGLWKTDVKGKWAAACLERWGNYKPFGNDYYNMGVALINLKQMRTDGIIPTMVEYLNTVHQPFADQDAWNKYGIEQGKITVLDGRYNESGITGKSNDPAIVHYCGIRNWWGNHYMDRHEYLEKYL